MSSATTSSAIHFKFLDAVRGLVALNVVVCHSAGGLSKTRSQYDYVFIAERLCAPFAMSGFFLLSSFLLTYRLYDEMNKITSLDCREYALIISKYIIRRFLRVYVVFFVWCSFFCGLSVISPSIEYFQILCDSTFVQKRSKFLSFLFFL